jgi:hypothetical protein
METVIRVVPRDGFQLELSFSTGETRLFDARPYLSKGAFTRLQDPALFRQAYVAFDTVCWPGHLDIAPETLYDRSVAIEEPQTADDTAGRVR